MKEKFRVVQVKVPDDLHSAIKQAAREQYQPIGAFSRYLLAEGLVAFREKKSLQDSVIRKEGASG